ncbi:hypothetical protein [Caulobacter sp. FWC26]|nr:hypothetical protein [Caulobacter sp. FWC26]
MADTSKLDAVDLLKAERAWVWDVFANSRPPRATAEPSILVDR